MHSRTGKVVMVAAHQREVISHGANCNLLIDCVVMNSARGHPPPQQDRLSRVSLGGRFSQPPLFLPWSSDVKKFLTAIASLLIFAIAHPAYPDQVIERTPQTKTYKIKLGGNWWRSFYTFIVVDILDSRTVRPKYVEHDNAFGTFKPASAKWFEFPARAVRACSLDAGSWGDQSCITSESPSITLPEGADLSRYRFDFKYEHNGSIQEKAFKYSQLVESEVTGESKLTTPVRPGER